MAQSIGDHCRRGHLLAEGTSFVSGKGYIKCRVCRRLGEFKRSIWTRYRLRLADYERMMDMQGDACASCEAPFGAESPHIDHCHTTGKVRGILCRGCNIAAGHLLDDPGRANALARYLKRTNA